jgi:hypothetical protein
MSSSSNPKVTIIDEDGTPVGVGANGLKVDVGGNIDVGTVTVALDSAEDSVECIQDTPANLKATVTQAGDVNIGTMPDITIGNPFDGVVSGDVSLLLDGTAADYGIGNVNAPGRTLRVTLATNDVMTNAMNDNLKDIETLLGTIDTDTGSMAILLGTIDGDTGNIATNTSTIAGDTTEIAAYFKPAGIEWTAQRGILAGVVRNDELATLYSVADGDISHLQVNSKGGLYVTGSEIESETVQSQPLLIGGRFDTSARTLGNGEAGAIALNASGHVLMDVVDGGQLDTIIDTLETTLTDIETDQAAIEILLTGIDSDTNTIQGAVSGSEMQVNIVSSATLSVNSHAVTNAGTFAVQASLPSDTFVIEDGALGKGVLIQGENGTDRKNVLVDGIGRIKVDLSSQSGGAVVTSSETPLGSSNYSEGTTTGSVIAVVRNDILETLVGVNNELAPLQVDGQGALYTTHGIVGMQSDNNEDIDDTTAEVLGSSQTCKRVDMQADSANTGYIYVGGTDVSATKGIRLAPGDFYSIDIDNVADIFVLASVDEEDIHFTYFT